MIRRPVTVSPVKAILAMRWIGCQGLADLAARASDHVEHAGGQDVVRQLREDRRG